MNKLILWLVFVAAVPVSFEEVHAITFDATDLDVSKQSIADLTGPLLVDIVGASGERKIMSHVNSGGADIIGWGAKYVSNEVLEWDGKHWIPLTSSTSRQPFCQLLFATQRFSRFGLALNVWGQFKTSLTFDSYGIHTQLYRWWEDQWGVFSHNDRIAALQDGFSHTQDPNEKPINRKQSMTCDLYNIPYATQSMEFKNKEYTLTQVSCSSGTEKNGTIRKDRIVMVGKVTMDSTKPTRVERIYWRRYSQSIEPGSDTKPGIGGSTDYVLCRGPFKKIFSYEAEVE